MDIYSKTISIRPVVVGRNAGQFVVVAQDDETGENIGGAYFTPSFAQANTYAESIADYEEGDTIVVVDDGDAHELVAQIAV
jgi:hypothetical protein